MERDEAKRKARNGENGNSDPLISDDDILAEATPEDADEDEDPFSGDEEEDEGPDLLLREAARIAADMAGFHVDMQRLEHAFSQLSADEPAAETLN